MFRNRISLKALFQGSDRGNPFSETVFDDTDGHELLLTVIDSHELSVIVPNCYQLSRIGTHSY